MRRPDNFDQGGAEALAARRLHPGAQDGLRIAPPHQRQERGIDAKLRQTDAIQSPSLVIEKIRPRPKQRPLRRGAPGQSQAEAGGGRPIGPRRMNFVQGGAVQSAAQDMIHLARAKSESLLAIRRAKAMPDRDPGENQPQASQGFDARHHSPLCMTCMAFARDCSCYVLIKSRNAERVKRACDTRPKRKKAPPGCNASNHMASGISRHWVGLSAPRA